MAANFAFPPPPPPPPPANAYDQRSSGSPQAFNSYGRGRGRGTIYQSQRGNRDGFTAPGHQFRGGHFGPPRTGYGGVGQFQNNNQGAPHRGGYSYQQRNGFSNATHTSGTRVSGFPEHNSWTGVASQGNNLHLDRSTPIRPGIYNHHRTNQSFTPLQTSPRSTEQITRRPNSAGQGYKRAHGEAFGKQDLRPKVQPAPAVPSFGASLSLPTPADVKKDESEIPKRKRKRQKNQLGLTPKGEDRELSEDDADEEAKLAALTANDAGRSTLLQFRHKGREWKLRTQEEIFAWIEERRKQFPTQAGVAKKKALKAEKANQTQTYHQKSRSIKQGGKQDEVQDNRKKFDGKGGAKKSLVQTYSESTKRLIDNAEPSVEMKKLRKTLEKTQKRLEKLEAAAGQSKKAQRVDSKVEESTDSKPRHPKSTRQAADTKPIPLTPSSEPAPLGSKSESARGLKEPDLISISRIETESSEHDMKDISDLEATSSPGSSSAAESSLESDSSLSDSSSGSSLSESYEKEQALDNDPDSDAPSQHSTGRGTLQRVAPPPRSYHDTKPACRNTQRYGKCTRKFCKYRHKLRDSEKSVEIGSAQNDRGWKRGRDMSKKKQQPPGRMSLYQRLLKQQLEEEAVEKAHKQKEEQDQDPGR